ncbi:hypothetical protein AAFF_G00157510 [Aldrovandia affinis]|uniref:Uncharacterized protein n=1 Tax=Aldrovandia affinis TaxID=143900 RepID=A0AAD7W923_9TELE|nr:hypothetical protein AAFF_G00157510 [Aldrovandia affinis]
MDIIDPQAKDFNTSRLADEPFFGTIKIPVCASDRRVMKRGGAQRPRHVILSLMLVVEPRASGPAVEPVSDGMGGPGDSSVVQQVLSGPRHEPSVSTGACQRGDCVFIGTGVSD